MHNQDAFRTHLRSDHLDHIGRRSGTRGHILIFCVNANASWATLSDPLADIIWPQFHSLHSDMRLYHNLNIARILTLCFFFQISKILFCGADWFAQPLLVPSLMMRYFLMPCVMWQTQHCSLVIRSLETDDNTRSEQGLTARPDIFSVGKSQTQSIIQHMFGTRACTERRVIQRQRERKKRERGWVNQCAACSFTGKFYDFNDFTHLR